MSSLRRLEGYYLSDNRVSGGALVELPTLTCSHCHRLMAVNPGRTRARAHCQGCHKYICDKCELIKKVTLTCKTKRQLLEETAEAIVLEDQRRLGQILISV